MFEFRLSGARDFDLDLGSGHTAYRHAPLVELYMHQISLKSKKLFVDGRTDGHLRPTLLGRLGGVDVTIAAITLYCDVRQLLLHMSVTTFQGYVVELTTQSFK